MRQRLLLLCACALALAGCTVPFTPGDAKEGTYTPYPGGGASAPSGASRY